MRKNTGHVSSARTCDINEPFVTGELKDEPRIKGRTQKLFCTCSDTKRLKNVKSVPRWHGQTFGREDGGNWHRDDSPVGGFVVNRKVA